MASFSLVLLFVVQWPGPKPCLACFSNRAEKTTTTTISTAGGGFDCSPSADSQANLELPGEIARQQA